MREQDMVARMGTIEIELDQQSKDIIERFVDSVDRAARLGETVDFDEGTMRRVYLGLAAAGIVSTQAIDAVNGMQNEGILFRDMPRGETTVDLTLDTSAWEAAIAESDPWAPAPPPAQIIEWPLKTRAPRLIVVCPVCSTNVDTEPLNWEIVLEPGAMLGQHGKIAARGLVQHEHDGGVVVRWPWAAEYIEPPEPVIDAYVADERDDDVDEGQEKNEAGDPWEFTPEPDGTLTTSSAIFQALGGASTCWENPGGAGEFDSTRAREIGDALLMLIEKRLAEQSDEVTRLDQIIYRARASLRSFHDEFDRLADDAPRVLDNVATILAAVDGPDSPRAKRLRGEA